MTKRAKSADKRGGLTGVIFGASGLTGGELWRLLEKDDAWSQITCPGRRRPQGLGASEKVKAPKVDLFDSDALAEYLHCDVVFICLGTTMKKAGSREAFWRIDVELPALIAATAPRQGARRIIAISAMGVHKRSIFFYNRAKTNMEEALRDSGIAEVIIVRPGLLLGNRRENRWAESLSGRILQRLDPVLARLGWHNFRAIPVQTVARAMAHIALLDKPKPFYENPELMEIGQGPAEP